MDRDGVCGAYIIGHVGIGSSSSGGDGVVITQYIQ